MKAFAEDRFRIELLADDSASALQSFLRQSGDASLFHSLEWQRVIQETYGHECHYWVAWSDQQIVGVFPVAVVRHPILGIKMVAMPYQFHSGLPLAENHAVQSGLVERAVAQARALKVKYLEIRHWGPAPLLEEIGFVPVDAQLVTTSSSLQQLDLRQMRKGHRNYIHYAQDRGVKIVAGESLADLCTFRRLYLVEGRKQGSPQAGWNFFENLHRRVQSSYRLLLAWYSNRCIGGLLTLDDGRTAFARCAVHNSPLARTLHLSKALWWQAISEAGERGCQTFEFGISWQRDNGLINFKEGWNGTTRPVHVYVYPIRSQAPVPGNYFEGFTLAKAIWRRLPLPVVDWAGRQVTQWVG